MLRGTTDNVAPAAMLETLLQNRLGLKYMQSRKLVASGREKLGMDESTPWTPELEEECIKLYEAEHGPVKQKDYSSPEPAKTVAADKPKDPTPSSSGVPAFTAPKPVSPPPAPKEEKKVEEEPNPAKEEEEAEAEPEKTPTEQKEAEETPEPAKEETPKDEEEEPEPVAPAKDADSADDEDSKEE